MRRVAVTVLVLALLAGTAVAFATTEALKLERSPIADVEFDEAYSPRCGCPTRAATLEFSIRRSDRLDLVIVRGDEPVRTLAAGVQRPKGRVSLRWDGRDDSGTIVPDGRYRLRVHLEDAHRTIVIPNEIEVDTRRPELVLVSAAPVVFSPDGDGRRDRVEIVYETDEDAALSILVDGILGAEGRVRRKGERRAAWNGRIGARQPEPGGFMLVLRVRDRAGNLSEPGDPLAVEIRFVEIPDTLFARRGERLRFRVETDAAAVSWVLRRPNGRLVLSDARARSGSVAARLPSSVRPGRYELSVSANGYTDRAVVHILRSRR